MEAIQIDCEVLFNRLVTALEQLVAPIKRLSPEPIIINKEYFGWQMHQVGQDKTFNQVVTLEGSVMSVTLPFSGPISLKRVELWCDSSNVKTFNVRMHSNINPEAYAQLDAVAASADISHIIDMGEGYVYLSGNKLVFNFSSYTATDTINIQIQLKDLI